MKDKLKLVNVFLIVSMIGSSCRPASPAEDPNTATPPADTPSLPDTLVPPQATDTPNVVETVVPSLDSTETPMTRFSRVDIEERYQTVGLSSDACQADPNSNECIDSWNYCAEDRSRTGCRNGFITNAQGEMIPTFSGFNFIPDVRCDHLQIVLGDCKFYEKIDN